MAQKYLISATQQDLEDIRDEFLTHSDICVPHKEDTLFYAEVQEDDDQDEWMLSVITEAEQYMDQADIDDLVDDAPANFLDAII